MQIKAVQFRATFTWLNSIANNGHAACDSNSEQHKVCVEVVKHGHERLILEAERTKCLEEKCCRHGGGGGSRRHTNFCCPSTSPEKGDRGPCAGVVPRAKFNQTGIQRAWGSPLAPLLDDVGLDGLLHATGSIAVDLATGPL